MQMGRGGHAGCNRTRVAWAGGTVAALGSAWMLLKAAVDFTLVIIFYGMLGFFAYSKRELLSSYCSPPGAHEGCRPSRAKLLPARPACAWHVLDVDLVVLNFACARLRLRLDSEHHGSRHGRRRG